MNSRAFQRPSKVIYDRAGSAISEAQPEDFDWERIFEGVSWFHFTGITLALGDNVARICLMACKKAREKGITVSCDLNYRKKLRSREKAGQVMGSCAGTWMCVSPTKRMRGMPCLWRAMAMSFSSSI